jgi:pyruvate kinase
MRSDFCSTKVIFTIGPATESEATIEALIRAGVDLCRINMAHASDDWLRMVVERVHRAGERLNRSIPIAMDIKGPEIRTGDLPEPLELQAAQLLDLAIETDDMQEQDGVPVVSVNYPGLIGDVREGITVLVDSGLISLKILEKQPTRLRCQVVIPGTLGNRRHLNLPGTRVNLPSVTDRDRHHVDLGAEIDVDFFMMSFVRDPEAIDELRALIQSKGSSARIIAKMEDQSAISNLERIVEQTDGVMIARGDLAIETPYDQLPIIQQQAAGLCKRLGKPFIIATQMLESMTAEPMPTRAEITDVANAVYQRADCVMLSDETTIGKYPVRCVEVMKDIALSIEHELREEYWKVHPLDRSRDSDRDQLLHAAVVLAQNTERTAYLVFTQEGRAPEVLAALRPLKRPIFAFTTDPMVQRQMRLLYAVEPFLMEEYQSHDGFLREAEKQLLDGGFVVPGDRVVVIDYSGIGTSNQDTIQFVQVGRVGNA